MWKYEGIRGKYEKTLLNIMKEYTGNMKKFVALGLRRA